MFERYSLRVPVEAYEVARVADGRRQYVINGSLVIDAELFGKLFVLKAEEIKPVAPTPIQTLAPLIVRSTGRAKSRERVNYSELVRQALKAQPMTNQELRKYIAVHGDPDVGSETIASVVCGLRRSGLIKKRDQDLRWLMAPKVPDVSGEVLPGSGESYPDSDR